MSNGAWDLRWKARGHELSLLRPKVIRKMPNALLARYFDFRSVLADLDLAALSETHPDALFEAWRELPEAQRGTMDTELDELFGLSSEKGWCFIRDEAKWHLRDSPEQFTEFVEKLSALLSNYDQASSNWHNPKRGWSSTENVLIPTRVANVDRSRRGEVALQW